jgi:hypothetical protein
MWGRSGRDGEQMSRVRAETKNGEDENKGGGGEREVRGKCM